jgi:citryl-CoA lyase
MANEQSPANGGAVDRRARARGSEDKWRTALTDIEPNKILVRGYPVDEMMGRVSFGEAIYLLLVGELPTPGMGRLIEAMLVSFIDHGPTPPSTLSARNTATTGATLRASVAAGVLGFGPFFGGDIAACMAMLDAGVARVRHGEPLRDAAAAILAPYHESNQVPPGFGHRYHTRDPRSPRLFQMALEFEVDAEHIRFMRALELAIQQAQTAEARLLSINVDGAIGAVCADLGLSPQVADGLFIISRVPGLVAHALEEHERHQPMRRIDPAEFVYDGPPERRLPETRRGN